jgi:hypothetical protein
MHAGNGRSEIDHSSKDASPWAKALYNLVTDQQSSPSTVIIKSVHIERMDTSKYDQCATQQVSAINQYIPDIIVAKAFGGALAMDLARRVSQHLHFSVKNLLLSLSGYNRVDMRVQYYY